MNEPTFTLTGSDKHAAALINLWTYMRRLDGTHEGTAEAELVADECVAHLNATQPEVDPSGIRALATALATFAQSIGVVVTIEQTPLKPLAQGHYTHQVTTRPARRREL